MAAGTPQGAKLLHGLKRATRFDRGIAAQLPAAYLKFYNEWKIKKPIAVHYIPKEGNWERDDITGVVRPIQNIPIPVIYPLEHNFGLWGGEGVVQGFQKRTPTKRRVPHFWVPVLRRSVVYSIVLDKYMSVTVTDRTMDLIHDSHGFDHYLLKTPACDLKSTLALGIKRKILMALAEGCPDLKNDLKKQKNVLSEYSKYLDQYSVEEIEWYGLTFEQACKKMREIIKAREVVVPHKIEYRSKLIDQLKQSGFMDDMKTNKGHESHTEIQSSSSWLSKINPFGKKQET